MTCQRNTTKQLSARAAIAVALILPFPLSAQAADTDRGALEEIVVTAEKREEKLQETPIAITAFTAAKLDQLGIENVADMRNQVPNLSMISGQGGGSTQNQISIRGVGQSDFVITSDQSVGLYLDGVYIARSLGAALDLLDIQRIEVLKGPQGTLFGRNTTAGAVQVISQMPTGQYSGDGEVTAGSYSRIDFKGDLNVPIIEDKLLSRISFATLNQGGYGERLTQGTNGDDPHVLAGRAAFLAYLTDSIDVNLIIDGSRRQADGGLETLVAINPNDPTLAYYNSFLTAERLPPADARYISSNPLNTYAGERNKDNNEIFGVASTITWHGEDVTVKSISAYRRLGAESAYSFSATPYPLAEQEINQRQHQISQEGQISGKSFADRLEWIFGVFYFNESASDLENVPFYQPVVATGGGNFVRVPGGYSFVTFNDQDTYSYAAFGQGALHITDALSAIIGLRYTYEDKTLYSYLTGAFVRPPGTVSKDFSDRSPKFGLEYQIDDDVMAYASISRGFRSGGFNGRDTSPLPPSSYAPESIWAYETGLKSEWLDHRLRLDGAAFYYDYSNFQGLTLGSFTGITVITGNIAQVELYGGELEATAKPLDNLEIAAGGGYTHQKIGSVAPGAMITIRPDTKLVNAPDWTATVSADYTVAVEDWGRFHAHIDYSWKSSVEFFLPNYPSEVQNANGVLGARITFEPPDKTWEAQVFSTNLSDTRYRLFAENGTALGVPATTAIYAPPREWGVRFRYHFR
jgi:iron complex outermembrane receptor protein